MYSKSGGQIGDTGFISNNNSNIQVHDTQKKLEKIFVHQGKLTKGKIKIKDSGYINQWKFSKKMLKTLLWPNNAIERKKIVLVTKGHSRTRFFKKNCTHARGHRWPQMTLTYRQHIFSIVSYSWSFDWHPYM